MLKSVPSGSLLFAIVTVFATPGSKSKQLSENTASILVKSTHTLLAYSFALNVNS